MHALMAAASGHENWFQYLIDGWYLQIGKYQLHYLELIGVVIGVISAWYGMKRRVIAWPVGILANVLLFFVYIGATFGADQRVPLFGQSGRQVFLFLTGVYGWWRWSQLRKARSAGAPDTPAVTPRWATNRERAAVAAFWILGTIVFHFVFKGLTELEPNPYWTPQWWYYWCDAWVFVGSMVATYAMARAWNEFWLAWIAVDLVGVPMGFATDYVPTAVMYIFYGLFVIYGFSQWVRITRRERASRDDELLASS